MKKNLSVIILLTLAHNYLLNAADLSMTHPAYSISYSLLPDDDPLVVFVTMYQSSEHHMLCMHHKDKSNLFVLQSHSCPPKLFVPLYLKLKEQLKKDKELNSENTFIQYSTMSDQDSESLYALTWINTGGEVFMKNYRSIGHEAESRKSTQDLIFHLLPSSPHQSMNIADDIPEKIAKFKQENPKKTLYDIARFATQNVQEITKPTSFIIIDHKKFKKRTDDSG